MQFVLNPDDWEPGAPVLEALGQESGYPVVTHAQLASFVEENRANDPNGNWAEVHVPTEGPHAGELCMTKADSADPDEWSYFQPAGALWSTSGTKAWVLAGWAMRPLQP